MDIENKTPTEKEIKSHFESIGLAPPATPPKPPTEMEKTTAYFASLGQEVPRYIKEGVISEPTFSTPQKMTPVAKVDAGNIAPLNSSIDEGCRITEPTVTVQEFMAVIAELKQTFVTIEEARAVAIEELPEEFRSLSATRDNITGNVLKLIASDTVGQPSQAYWGSVAAGATPAALLDTDWAFSIKSIYKQAVTFNAGTILQGTRASVPMSEETFDITKHGQMVFINYTMGGGAGTWNLTADATYPLSSSGTYVKVLQSFVLEEKTAIDPVTGLVEVDPVTAVELLFPTAVPLLTYHRGVIQLDGIYG